MMREIAIVGGGFGGVRVAQKLARWGKDIHITLIDKDRYHTFYPDLYEVATANLSEVFAHLPLEFYELRSTSAYLLEDIFFHDTNVTVLKDEVVSIDFKKNEILLKSGISHPYEMLVLGAGSETNYFNIPGLFDHAFPLKTLWDALSLRNAIDELFSRTPKNHSISIVIGGGGFTGCELTGELRHYMRQLAQGHGHPQGALSITMIEASATLLPGIDSRAQSAATKRLRGLGVQLIFNAPITAVENKNVILQDESRIPFDMFIWTAGVRANALTGTIPGLKLEKNFCVTVDEYLQIRPFTNVFGVGDMTYCINPVTGRSMPMTATVAMAQADCVVSNIIAILSKKTLSKYRPSYSGFIIPLGGRYAIITTSHFYMQGFVPWILKRLVALHYWVGVIGWKKAFALWKGGVKIFLRNDVLLSK